MPWTTPDDVKARLLRLWNRGRILAARIDGTSLFPMQLPLGRPDARALSERFDDVRQWIRALDEQSRARQGHGYEIEWTEIDHRRLGRNRVPRGLVVPTEDDALRLIGKSRDAQRFQRLADATLVAFPSLRVWLGKHPLTVVEQGDDWPRVLAVLRWFADHPRPALYLRQLDIADVDTKFIEGRKALLAELLDQTLPPDAVESRFSGAAGFEERYGLRYKPSVVRFRILDAEHHIRGLSDLSVTAAELARLELPIARVFITENEINGLAFPDVADSIVVFGLGYGLDRLSEIRWMKDKAVYYWGDIDTHGFAMLDRLRVVWPGVRSMLMDRETLNAHRGLWVTERDRHRGPLPRLTDAEHALFDDLVQDRLGENVRLEQERISFQWLTAALTRSIATTS